MCGSSGQSYFLYPMMRIFGSSAFGSIGVNVLSFGIGVASAGGDACGTIVGTVGVIVIGLAFGTGKPEPVPVVAVVRSSFAVVGGVTGNAGACTVMVLDASSSSSCGHKRFEWNGTWFDCFNDSIWTLAIGTP